MSSHLYIPASASLWSRMTAHAVEVVLSVYGLIVGMLVLVNLHDTAALGSSTLSQLPPLLVAGVAASLSVGGGLALFGLLVPRQDLRKEINVEQAGWLLCSLGWAGYGLATLAIADGTAMSVTSSTIVATAGVWRAYALRRLERDLDALEVPQ